LKFIVAIPSISATNNSLQSMKATLFSAIAIFANLVPAFAIIDADITPAALVGKTLTFTINNAAGAFANTGRWTGTFGSPAFTVANVTGNTVDIPTTHSTVVNNGSTIVTIPKFIDGYGTTTITLFTDGGIGRYEMNFQPVDSAFQIGTFGIGMTAPRVPEIAVKLDNLKEIESDASDLDIGSANIGKSVSQSFTITNTGSAPLKKLAISISGKHQADYKVTPLKKNQLAIDGSINFKVTFKPRAAGAREATVRILSNDKNESPFKINLSSNGFKN